MTCAADPFHFNVQNFVQAQHRHEDISFLTPDRQHRPFGASQRADLQVHYKDIYPWFCSRNPLPCSGVEGHSYGNLLNWKEE